jgi:hypothetical protein
LISKIFILLLISGTAQAFDKDFKTVNDRVPLEFQLLFESMKIAAKTPSDKLQLVGIAKELDENLGTLQKEHIFFLMKSEVIKNVLEYKHKKVRSFDMTTFLIERLEEDFKKKEKLLSPFAQWLWRSVIAELNHRKAKGLITNQSFNPNAFDGAKKIEAQRFARYLNYLMPWIDKMDSLPVGEFNQLIKEVSWVVLNRLNDRSILFKRFASTSTAETKVTLFNIPERLVKLHPEDIKRMQSDDPPLTLKEESEKDKTEARDQIQGITPDDLSPLSDEVNKELEEKTP